MKRLPALAAIAATLLLSAISCEEYFPNLFNQEINQENPEEKPEDKPEDKPEVEVKVDLLQKIKEILETYADGNSRGLIFIAKGIEQ